MLKAYKYRIYPNSEQRIQIAKTFGCCRFVYNQTLAYRKEIYKKEKKSVSKTDCNNYCNRELKKDYEWLKEIDKFALTNAIYNMNTAYQKFFKEHAGYPKFKSKHDNHKSYTTNFTNGNIAVDFETGKIKLPKLKAVKARLHREYSGQIKSATVSHVSSGKYYVSILVETEHKELEDTNPSKYVNYLNIASIYVDNLGSDTADMPQRTIALLTEANEKLDENSTALSNALPEDRNVKYYTAQYARILYSVYSYQAKNTNVDAEKETYYLSAIDSLNRYLASIDITDPNLPDTTKKSYVKYMKEEAETYIALEKISDNKDYYDQAEKVYSSAESSMGTVDNAADIYVSHLTYLYDRYSGEYGSNPKRWKQDGIQKIKAVYDAGSKINILASRGNNEWNSLIVNSAISDIINGNTAVTGSEE